MAQVSASQTVEIAAVPDAVLAALSDYTSIRPQILPEQYLDYRVVSGGTGAGTRAQWTLQATSKRSRNVDATVSVNDAVITETDANSSMVTTYTVSPSGRGSTVSTTTSWQGAGGIGGFFEKTFAPKGLNRIQSALLGNLKSRLEA